MPVVEIFCEFLFGTSREAKGDRAQFLPCDSFGFSREIGCHRLHLMELTDLHGNTRKYLYYASSAINNGSGDAPPDSLSSRYPRA